MITSDFVFKAIGDVVSRFKASQLHIKRHNVSVENEDGETWELHFYVEDEVKTMLDGLRIQSDVRLIDMYSATHIDVAVLAISFMIEGKLYSIDYVVEGDNY